MSQVGSNELPSVEFRTRWTLAQHARHDWIPYSYLIFVALLTFLPFVLMLTISLKSREQYLVSSIIPTWPIHPENYWYAAQVLWRPIFNTAFVAALATVGTLSVASLSAYAFARYRFPGDSFLFYGIISLLMVPGVLMLVPRYVIVAQLGMVNTLWALILPYMASGQIFGIFVLRTFFASIPQELIDSGKIDGASDFAVFWHIVLPLSKPILATLAILQMLNIKNDFIWPLVTLGRPYLRTLTLQLRLMESDFGTEWGMIMAGYALACVPILVVFAFATRPFIQGMTSGAIKM